MELFFLLFELGAVLSFCTGCHKLCSWSCYWGQHLWVKGECRIVPKENLCYKYNKSLSQLHRRREAGVAFRGVLSWDERISLYTLCLPVIKGMVTQEGSPPRPEQLLGSHSAASCEQTSFLKLGNECLSPERTSEQNSTESKSINKGV